MHCSHSLLVFSVLVTVAGMYLHATANADTSPRRQLQATHAASAPVIDGRLSDACWQEAAKADGFSVFANADELHPEQTIGRVCYDDEHLYVALECVVQEMDKFRARLAIANGRFEYFHGGAIELFLDTNGDRKTFQQYLLHANGSATLTLSAGDTLKILNDQYMRTASALTETGFTVEMALPLAMLHLVPDTSRVWGFNLNRAHDLYDERYDKNAQFSSWNSTRGKGFQSPEFFGSLAIDADFSPYYWQVAFVAEPRLADRSIQVRVRNQTGKNFTGSLLFTLSRPGAQATKFEAQ